MATGKHREKQVEARICQRAREHGGRAYKFTSPGRRAVPDRYMLMPCWSTHDNFIEAKAPGKKPTASQLREHEAIRARGGNVFVVDSYEACDRLFAQKCNGSCLL